MAIHVAVFHYVAKTPGKFIILCCKSASLGPTTTHPDVSMARRHSTHFMNAYQKGLNRPEAVWKVLYNFDQFVSHMSQGL